MDAAIPKVCLLDMRLENCFWILLEKLRSSKLKRKTQLNIVNKKHNLSEKQI